MRRLGTLTLYWVVACCAALALFPLLTPARFLVPLGRALLLDGRGGWRNLKNGRRWAEAAAVTLAWGWAPWIIYLAMESSLRSAGISLPWLPGSGPGGGTAAWWFIGVGLYFGLLHRRVLAALIGGTFALLWQWVVMGAELVPTLRPLIPNETALGYLIHGLLMGLVLALADFLSEWKRPAPNGE
ncbi:MAG: hypothetical protein K0R39_3490 [Symbiobacteriaceae bacterium]|nr:hypothetical protein [Symbiobacteriaceae bacterium]